MGVAGCKPTVGAERVENDVKAIQKRVPFTSKCSQKRWRLGLRPRPSNSEGGERFLALASLTRRVENGVKAIQKLGSIYTQITRESGRTPSTLASLTRKMKMVLTLLLKMGSIHSQLLQSPKSVGGWGSAPDPLIARESAFALASLTR